MPWKSRILAGLASILFPCATLLGSFFICMLFSHDRDVVFGAAMLLVPIAIVWYVSLSHPPQAHLGLAATFTEDYAFDGKVYQVVSGYHNYIRHPAAVKMYQEFMDREPGANQVSGKNQYHLDAFSYSDSKTASLFLGMRKNALYHIEIKPGLGGEGPRMLELLSRKLEIVE